VDNRLYDRLADMTCGEFGARNRFRETRDKSMLYAGHALKPA
jgi:hypothetical protein